MPNLGSTALEYVGYDKRSHTLKAIFKPRRRAYAYKGVPEQLYKKLLTADSKGNFLNTQIKPFFSYKEIDPQSVK